MNLKKNLYNHNKIIKLKLLFSVNKKNSLKSSNYKDNIDDLGLFNIKGSPDEDDEILHIK
jgi:hypothetical protein